MHRSVTLSNSGLPYPIRCSAGACTQIELPGVPLGSFPGVNYDEVSLPLQRDDLFVFCSDGIFEAMNEEGSELGARRLCDIVQRHQGGSARAIVDAIFEAVTVFRGSSPQLDDMTAVAVKITA
jgi:sigma-B regulation protein RsbU (phosphoserine phosphatase)